MCLDWGDLNKRKHLRKRKKKTGRYCSEKGYVVNDSHWDVASLG